MTIGKGKRSAPKRDFMQVGRAIVEQAIGEQMDGNPLPVPDMNKDPKAVSRGRVGGLKGGPARAVKLTPVQRKRIAAVAAKARWGTPVQKKD
jgi:hypothetical protein